MRQALCFKAVLQAPFEGAAVPAPACARDDVGAPPVPADHPLRSYLSEAARMQQACLLTAEQRLVLEEAHGSLEALRDLFSRCVTDARGIVKGQQIVFGSADHLRLQYSRVGDVVGVPVVMLVHETTIGNTMRELGEWESRQAAMLQAVLRPGDVAVDVGAHVGTHASAFSYAVHPGGVVHAFEAQQPVRDVLAANAALTGNHNIVVHHAAVGFVPLQTERAATLRVRTLDVRKAAPRTGDTTQPTTDHETGNFGGFSLLGCKRQAVPASTAESTGAEFVAADHPLYATDHPLADTFVECAGDDTGDDTGAGSSPYVTVPVVQLDDFKWYAGGRRGGPPGDGPCPRMIKFDVEGMEEEALLGANATLRLCRPFVHVENNRGATSGRLVELLSDAFNYRLYWDTGRYVDSANYFGRKQRHAVELQYNGGSATFSPNLLGVPREVAFDDLPPLLKPYLKRMTRASPSAPLLSDVQGGVKITEYLPARLDESPDSSAAGSSWLFVRHPIAVFNNMLGQM